MLAISFYLTLEYKYKFLGFSMLKFNSIGLKLLSDNNLEINLLLDFLDGTMNLYY